MEIETKVGAPVGNQNAAKSREFEKALTRIIAQEDGKRLRAAAEKLLDLAVDGTQWAMELLIERLDGKADTRIDVRGAVIHEHRTVQETAELVRDALGLRADRSLPESLPH